MSLKRRLTSMEAGIALGVASLAGQVAMTTPASASGAGSVNCSYNSETNIVGVWVQVTNGTSGWASRWNNGYGGNYYSYYEIDNGKSYSLHIGCGGTPSSWHKTYYTGSRTGYHDWVCSQAYGCVES